MDSKKKIIIVGAGEAGIELVRELKGLHNQYDVIGFVDDDKEKVNQKIEGVLVYGPIVSLGKLIKKNDIRQVIIAIPSASGETIRKIITSSKGTRVIFKIIPRTLEMVTGNVRLEQLRDVELSDLFGKAIVQAEQPAFEHEFTGQTILVTGAAGSIGSELCRQLIQFGPQTLVAFDWWENGLYELENELEPLKGNANLIVKVGNIQDLSHVRDTIRRYKPDVIYHAAAFKHVPLMQNNPLEAIRNNIFGTENVARVAYEEGVSKFVFISTDKAADPSSIMGATKLIGEHVITVLNNLGRTRYSAVRFGNVMESHGSVFPLFRKQIVNGGPVTVTDPNMTRYFMTIPEAVQLVLQASILGYGGEIFILEMGEQIKIDDVARYMIQLSGLIPNEDIKIQYIGRRPGEKLEERLFSENELIQTLENVKDSRIFKISQHSENISLYDLSELKRAVDQNDLVSALAVIKKFAPEIIDENIAKIPFSRPSLDHHEIDNVIRILESGWLTMGEETIKFEEEFAEYVGAKYAVAVNSCTSALFLAVKALGIGPGDEVIVPSFTFPSTVSVIIHAGATPVFADIEENDLTMDQKSFESVITPKTKAVMPVHYAGRRVNLKTNLPIIEDSAHFIPKGGDNPNSFARCYSFYATKNMTTGEGGMVTTNDEKIRDWLIKARLHGLSKDAWKRYQVEDQKSKWVYEVEFPGYKFNTTDINSALGREQLKKLEAFEKRRREVVALYNELLGLNNHGTHLYPILIENRDKFFQYMQDNGVGCSFHFLALHKEPAFKKYAKGKLPVTEHVAERVVTLPLDAVITDEEIRRVATLTNEFLENESKKNL